MTLQELKNEIIALGFESELENTDAFSYAVRRAIATVYTERGIHKSFRIYQRNPKPDFHIKTLIHEGGTVNTFPFTDGAYFFRASGSGAFSVTDKNGTRESEFNSNGCIVRGYMVGAGEITFSGDLCYTVYDLCHFKDLFSNDLESLNYGEITEYQINKLVPDYLGPYDRPRDSGGMLIDGCEICSGTLSVPYSYDGEIVIKYRCKPPIDKDAEAADELDIDPECEHLIPLLAASYVWLDDDAEKAQYYMSLYREGMAALKLYSPRCVDAEYENVTGWA